MSRPSQLVAQGCVCGTERSRCLPVNVMEQETDEGLAYLQALKGSAPAPAARAVPANEPNSAEAPERASAQNSGALQTFALEKRHSPRYAGDGSTVNTPPHQADEGLAYLQALKQSAPTTAASAPAREANSGEAHGHAQLHNLPARKLSFWRSAAVRATNAKAASKSARKVSNCAPGPPAPM